MATTKKSKAVPAKGSKQNAAKVSAAKTGKPQPRKSVAAGKASPKKTTPRAPQPVKKPMPGKPAPIAKPKVAAKTAPQPKPAKKGVPSPAAPIKDLSKKPVKTASAPAPKALPKPLFKPVSKPAPKAPDKPAVRAEPKKPRLNGADLEQFKRDLLAMRDRITGQSGSMRNDALQRTDEINPEEDGTDAFMRLQALEQVSSQQLIIANIDESLRSIEKGTYGVCDACGDLINKPRLSVLPFAKNCIKCQSEMERVSRPGGRR
jgi:RNA polymerase-binding transcription factor DksA